MISSSWASPISRQRKERKKKQKKKQKRSDCKINKTPRESWAIIYNTHQIINVILPTKKNQ
jgi:hypothetical protein